MTVLNVIRRPVTVIVQGRGLMGFKGDKGDPGNLTGPASSVDENIPIFDGIAGDKLKDSGVKLSDKADITALETEKKLLMDEIDVLKKASTENSNAPYLTVSDYGDVTLAKNSVGVGTMGIDGVTVENLENGWGQLPNTYGWTVGANITDFAVSDSVMSFVGGGAPSMTGGNWVNRPEAYAPVPDGDWWACVVWAKADDNATKLWTGFGYVSYLSKTLSTTYQMYIFKDNKSLNTGSTRFVFGADIGKKVYIDGTGGRGIRLINLTEHGLASLTETQLAKLLPTYFDGKKTFGGVGCLVSKDSAGAETGRMYFSTTPMYSNDTAKDVITYSGGKYYHTHNVDADGVTIAEPYDTEVDTNGQIVCLSGGTVTYEPWYPDIGIYTDKFALTKAITAVKELYKYGSETPITDAVIAEDGLSFTSASLTAGDLAYGVFEFDEPLRPLMTIKSRNDDATVVDTSTGTVYTFRPVVTDGVIASWELTEV